MEILIFFAFLIVLILIMKLNKWRDIFEPINFFVLLYILFFIIRPFSILLGYSNPFNLDYGDIIKGMFIGFLGFMSFVLGYYSSLSKKISSIFPLVLGNKNTFAVSLILLMYNIVSLVGIFIVINNVGLNNIFLKPITVAFYLKKGGGLISYLFRFSYVALLISLSYILFCSKKLSVISMYIVSLIINLMISIIIGVRGFLGQIMLSIFFLYFYSNRKRFSFIDILKIKYILFLFVILFLAYVVTIPFNIFRNYGIIDYEKIKSLDFIWNQIQAFLVPFDWFSYINKFGEVLFFKSYLYTFINFIPRNLWEDKPVTSVLYYLTEKYIGDPLYYPTYTMTIIGELHIQMPYIGVIIILYLIGLLFKLIYIMNLKYHYNYLLKAFYIMLLVSFIRGFYTSFQTWFLEGILFNFILFLPFVNFFNKNLLF